MRKLDFLSISNFSVELLLHTKVEHMQRIKCPIPAEIGISDFRVSNFRFQCYTFDPHVITMYMQRNAWPLPAEIEISDFIVSDFRFQCCTFDCHAESGISSDFLFKCCTIAPNGIAKHMQWNAESEISSNF